MTAPTRSRSTRTAERAGRGRRADSAVERRREGRLAARAAAASAPAEAPPRPRRTPEPPERSAGRSRRTPESPTGRSRSVAAQRAYARRAQREGRRPDPVEHDEDRAAGRASFVILIIALLAVGVAATLWLSTQAIADSYRLESAKDTAGKLAERADQLQREVTKAESLPALAERAKAMGMVPGGDPARLVVQSDGRVVVVGDPTAAEKPKPPAPPASAPPSSPPAAPPADPPPGQQDPQGQAGNTPGAG